jgi:hypothetical protein
MVTASISKIASSVTINQDIIKNNMCQDDIHFCSTNNVTSIEVLNNGTFTKYQGAPGKERPEGSLLCPLLF